MPSVGAPDSADPAASPPSQASLLPASPRRASQARRTSSASLPFLALYSFAFLVRAVLADLPLYGDEAAHFYVAGHWGAFPSNLHPSFPDFTASLWWQRPLFSVGLWPATATFASYRWAHVAISSLVPVLAAAWTSRHSTRTWGLAAGAALAVHPTLVVWGVRVFPDSLMAVLVLAGLLLGSTRPVVGAVLLLAGVWVKESAAVILGLVAVQSAWRAWRAGNASFWPLRLDESTTALGLACLLAPLPLLHSLLDLHGAVPGWSRAAFSWSVVDTVLLSAWLAVPLAAGLRWRTTRGALWPALALLGFYLAYSLRGNAVEAWYGVLPGAFAVAGAAAVLAHLTRRLRGKANTVAACAFAVLVALPAFAPTQAATPLSPTGPSALADAARGSRDLEHAYSAVAALHPGSLFLADVGWFYVLHPFSGAAANITFAYTEFPGNLTEWSKDIETRDATLVGASVHPLNAAMRAVYHDCLRAAWRDYALFEGKACAGREGELRSTLARERVKAPPAAGPGTP